MEHAAPSPRLLVLGNLLLDDVVYADGSTRMGQPGGAALYAALGAALWQVPVGIVTRLGSDYPPAVLEALAARGVALSGGPEDRPTLRTWLLYEGRRRRVVHRLEGPTHDEVSPRAEEIPGGWRPEAIHLAPMPWSVQRELVAALAPRREILLAADPYELLTAENLGEWQKVFGRVDTLFVSEDEMQIPEGLVEPAVILARLAGDDPARLRSIFYKRGDAGGLVWRPGGEQTTWWSARATTVVDPTGAGDAFAGGVLAAALAGASLEGRLQRGVVSAAFALEAAGAYGLLAATPAAAERRLAEWFPDSSA